MPFPTRMPGNENAGREDAASPSTTEVMEDRSGNPYEYRGSEVFVVTPDADWAVDPVRGRDMLTLQTCTLPDLRNRIIVRADRVEGPEG